VSDFVRTWTTQDCDGPTVLSVGYPVGAIILSVPKPLAVVGSSVGNA
jgi:hypothetical protein